MTFLTFFKLFIFSALLAVYICIGLLGFRLLLENRSLSGTKPTWADYFVCITGLAIWPLWIILANVIEKVGGNDIE